jgi:predicted component of type VI protein secretion system
MLAGRILSFILVSCLAGGALPAAVLAQQPTPAPAVDVELQQQILKWKLQAQEALDAQDQRKAQELYRKILKLDPNDALAQSKNDSLTAALAKKKMEDVGVKVAEDDRRAREARAQEFLQKANDKLVDAKRTGAGEPLEGARQFLIEARKDARFGDPTLARLQAQIDEETDARRRRLFELWGFVGLVALGLIAALVFYFLRGGRVLEMIEGPQIGQQFVLQKETSVLGALASEVDWTIEDPLRKISRRHCDVVRQGRHYFLVDSSMNGTFLNGRPVQKGQPVLLKRGDQIGLGGAVTLRFR